MFGLRAKMILTLVAVVVPILFSFSYYRWGTERQNMIELRADRVATRIAARPGRVCDEVPGNEWQPRGMRVFTYDDKFTARLAGAPLFPTELMAALGAGVEDIVHTRSWPDSQFLGATAARLDTEGPCSMVLMVWATPEPPQTAWVVRRVGTPTLLLALVLALVGLLISAPLVYRLRRLMVAVKNASGERFDNPERGGTDEVAALAGAFGATLEALHVRDDALKEYIANTTHDLAIPLTILQHKLIAIRTRLGDDDEVAAEHIHTAIEESHYIGALIANMSAAARLEAGQVLSNTAEVRLDELVARVAGRHSPIAAPKGIALNWSVPEAPITTLADATLIEQAVSNLVQNAVQYNQTGGHVSIILDNETLDGFELRVIDDGPGIPPELIGELFKRGVRTDDARSRNPEGQGFGLSIAHEVCERHGWSLQIVAREGGGTEAVMVGRRNQAGPT